MGSESHAMQRNKMMKDEVQVQAYCSAWQVMNEGFPNTDYVFISRSREDVF
jgi:hypothetical protein